MATDSVTRRQEVVKFFDLVTESVAKRIFYLIHLGHMKSIAHVVMFLIVLLYSPSVALGYP